MKIKSFEDYIKVASQWESDYAGTELKVPSLAPHNPVKLVHYALGLATEAIELEQAIKRAKPRVEQLMELSDLIWFSGMAAAETGILPDLARVRKLPTTGLPAVYELCEDFASSIKAALVYGSPFRKAHNSLEYWKSIPAEIFVRVVAIGDAASPSKCIMSDNIAKLTARYGNKYAAAKAVARDEKAETKAVTASADEIKKLLDAEAESAKPAAKAPLLNELQRFQAALQKVNH